MRATKLSCSVYGPMQKQNDASSQSNEACTIKVSLEFADSMRGDQILLEQYASLEEDLQRQMDTIGTKGGGDSVKERAMRTLNSTL